MMRCPASTLPVRLTMSVMELEERASPRVLPPPVTKFTTPAGKSSSVSRLAKCMTVAGAILLGLITVVQPTSSEGATLRAMTKKGKFHGQMPTTTPMGLRYSRIFSRGRSLWMISPS